MGFRTGWHVLTSRRAFSTTCAAPGAAPLALADGWRRVSVNTANWTVAEIGALLTTDFGGAWTPESKQELARLFQVIRSAGA